MAPTLAARLHGARPCAAASHSILDLGRRNCNAFELASGIHTPHPDERFAFIRSSGVLLRAAASSAGIVRTEIVPLIAWNQEEQLESYMTMSNCQVLIGVATIILSGFSFAGEVTREGAVELMEECQRQRQINIAPLREQAIEDCVTNRRRDRESCERHNRNFGERRSGGTVVGMFWGLPECEQALAAERHFRMNPRSQVFNLP